MGWGPMWACWNPRCVLLTHLHVSARWDAHSALTGHLLKVLRRSGDSLLTSPVSSASIPGTTCCSSSKDEVSGWHVGTEYFFCYQVLMFWVGFPSAEMEEVDQTSLWRGVPWSGKLTLGLSGLPHTRTDSAIIRRQGEGNVSYLSMNYQFSF